MVRSSVQHTQTTTMPVLIMLQHLTVQFWMLLQVTCNLNAFKAFGARALFRKGVNYLIIIIIIIIIIINRFILSRYVHVAL